MEVACFLGGGPYETLVQLPNLRFGAAGTKDMQDPGLLRFRITMKKTAPRPSLWKNSRHCEIGKSWLLFTMLLDFRYSINSLFSWIFFVASKKRECRAE